MSWRVRLLHSLVNIVLCAGGEKEGRTVLKNFVEVLQMIHDDIAMLFENGQGEEEMEAAGEIICPERFPETENVRPFEFALVPDNQHAEEKEEVGAVGGLEVQVELGVHELNEVVDGEELGAHAGLVAEEVLFLYSLA